jgi:hypothetical protein
MKNQTERKSFILHKDSLEILDKLSDEQAGKLFKAIKKYQNGEDQIDLDFALDLVFTNFLNQFKRDEEKWLKVRGDRIEAGSKGGKQKVANASKTKQKVANVAVSVSDSVSDNVNESVNNNFLLNNQFEEFWESYKPIHTSKGSKQEAKIVFLKALEKNSFDEIMAGLNDYMNFCHSKGSYTKQAYLWLKKQCWKDDYQIQTNSHSPPKLNKAEEDLRRNYEIIMNTKLS